MTIILFLAIISLLVFFHELGHFFMAKLFGVGVEEFGFGIPPRVFGKKIKGTLYSINLLPLGGFVKLRGDEADNLKPKESGGEYLGFSEGDSMAVKSKPKRALIMIAGVGGNLLLAWLIFWVLFVSGFPRFSKSVRVDTVVGGSPAQTAGIKPGDLILSISDIAIEDSSTFSKAIKEKAGQEVTLKVQSQNDNPRDVKLTPRKDPPSGQGPTGVRVSHIYYDQKPWYTAPYFATLELGQSVKEIFVGLGQMITNIFTKQEAPQVTGIIGLYSLTSEVAPLGWQIFLQFVAVISLNLFLFNLFPIPALDGGRLLFIGIEMLVGKVKARKWEVAANNVGFAFLILLFILITFQDLFRLFIKS